VGQRLIHRSSTNVLPGSDTTKWSELAAKGDPGVTNPPRALGDDAGAARRALAEKVAYYGHALGPLILDRLGLTRDDFAPIEHAVMVERDLDRACSMVDARMLRIGVAGAPDALVARLRPLVAAGVQHLSFGPPLGPDPLRAVELLGRDVLPALRP
jgi:5,10-methylenetetrahydromethanopterin reductase